MKRKKQSIQQIVDQYWPSTPEHRVDAAVAEVWPLLQEELKKHDNSLRSLYGDGWNVGPLSDREFRVLTAVSSLGECDGLEILRVVEQWDSNFDVVHISLFVDTLRLRKFVTERRIDATLDRGARRMYTITDEGERALRRANEEKKPLSIRGRAREDAGTERA